MSVPGAWYLTVAAVLFTIGANLTFVTFARMLDDIGGQAVVFFVMTVAAAEVVVGLGLIVAVYRRRVGATADDLHIMKG